MIGIGEVGEAAERLRGRIRETGLERSPSLGEAAGGAVWMKLENHQRTGSFKVRGALNALASLPPDERARGVVTASAGNHGLGVALAARELGIRATVFVPADAPAVKRRRIAGLGAELRPVGGGYDDAHREGESHAEETGAVYVHAFSDPAVVAGQGTVGLEIFAALPQAAAVLVPVGGGGLIGGIGVVARARAPRARVIGVQSTATRAMHDSLQAGRAVPGPVLPTLCDGLAGDVDRSSLELAQRVVDEVILVEENEVREAMRRLHAEEGLVVEGSGAVAAAAIWSGRAPPIPGGAVVVLTGGNVDAIRLVEVLG